MFLLVNSLYDYSVVFSIGYIVLMRSCFHVNTILKIRILLKELNLVTCLFAGIYYANVDTNVYSLA
jgi:hypothetical protein